jgi:hypothetical protein
MNTDPFDIEALRKKPEEQAESFRLRRRAPHRRRWEYLVQATADPFPAEDLDALGSKGWRLCAAIRDGGLIHHTFVRPTRGGTPP